MRLLPPSTVPPQVLSVVVDLGPNSNGSTNRDGGLASTVEQLARMLDDFQVAVTWAMDETDGNDLVDSVLTRDARHDIALRADGDWSGPMAGRGTFSRGLSRRVQQAEASGLEITSLYSNAPICRENLDLLIKYGIDLIATGDLADPQKGCVRTLRYGLWQLKPAIVLPELDARWSPFNGLKRRSCATIDQTIQGEAFCLVVIDASRMGERRQLAALEIMLRHAHRRNRQGVLSLQTLEMVADQLREKPEPRSACSILRAA